MVMKEQPKKVKAANKPIKSTKKKPVRKRSGATRVRASIKTKKTGQSKAKSSIKAKSIRSKSAKSTQIKRKATPKTGQVRNKVAKKTSKKALKTAAKKTKSTKAVKGRKNKSSKSSKSSRTALKSLQKTLSTLRAHSFRLLMLSMIAVGACGFAYGHHMWAKGYAYALAINSTKQAPSKITTAGPAQSSPHFSTYPTWSQNYRTDASGKLNSKYWNIFKGAAPNGNDEEQYYTDSPSNIQIKGGALSLTAKKQNFHGYKYTSARVDTKKKLSFRYGRVDVNAKLPKGVGTWPAVWFLPANTKYRDMSPPSDKFRYLNGGEIDLIEAVGFNPNINYGVVHTRSDLTNHTDGVGSFNQSVVSSSYSDYNKYSLLWTPSSITFEVNNAPYFTYHKPAHSDYTTWSFDQPFYMIMNLAVGGVWGGQEGVNNSALPASLDIQSIYYYPYISTQ
jgi:beta-glucanase (GH16 family)